VPGGKKIWGEIWKRRETGGPERGKKGKDSRQVKTKTKRTKVLLVTERGKPLFWGRKREECWGKGKRSNVRGGGEVPSGREGSRR